VTTQVRKRSAKLVVLMIPNNENGIESIRRGTLRGNFGLQVMEHFFNGYTAINKWLSFLFLNMIQQTKGSYFWWFVTLYFSSPRPKMFLRVTFQAPGRVKNPFTFDRFIATITSHQISRVFM
jgi:hypothetical protein